MESIQLNSPLVRQQNTGDEVEERGFARAAGAAQGHLLPGIKRESRHIDHSQDGSVRSPVALAQIFDTQQQRREDWCRLTKFQVSSGRRRLGHKKKPLQNGGAL